jgi:hypothetical protein
MLSVVKKAKVTLHQRGPTPFMNKIVDDVSITIKAMACWSSILASHWIL